MIQIGVDYFILENNHMFSSEGNYWSRVSGIFQFSFKKKLESQFMIIEILTILSFPYFILGNRLGSPALIILYTTSNTSSAFGLVK